MPEPNKTEQSIRTILRFLDEYIIKHSPFISDMFKNYTFSSKEEKILLKKINVAYTSYLSGGDTFCKTLVNEIGQRYALRRGLRENAGLNECPISLSDGVFGELCKAADMLQIVSGHLEDDKVDFIVVPGGLQGGVEKRIRTVLNYLQEHTGFQGKILFFGTRDRKLYPFTSQGNVRESMVFDLLAGAFKGVHGSAQNTVAIIQNLLSHQYHLIKQQSRLSGESEIVDQLAQKWKQKTGLEWPTEYQMVSQLADEKLKPYSFYKIETCKGNKNEAFSRATTQDEAPYIAEKIKELTQKERQQDPDFIPHIAIVTHYGYQVQTYRNIIQKSVKDAKINMLSPYKNTEDLFYNFWVRKWSQEKSVEKLRGSFAMEVLDSFARLIYSQNHECRLEKVVRAWRQKEQSHCPC